jgi:subtilisin family serine protease
MRTLSATILLTLISTTSLAGQVIHRPTQPRRSAPQTSATTIYIVTFRGNVSASDREAVIRASGARTRRNFSAVNAASVEVPDAAVLARLRNDPRILSVYVNQPITLLAAQRGGAGNGGGGAKPKAPTNLGASAASSNQINLSWTDASDNETGFAIERCTGAGCANFAEVSRVGVNIDALTDLGLTPQTTYRYRVLSFNAAGNSKYSNIADATTPTSGPTIPTAPNNLTASAISYNQINISWSDNSNNEDGFRVERCTGSIASCGDVNFVQIDQVGPNIASFNNAGLQPQTTYTYRVRAFNSAGTSGFSNYVATTTAAAPPAAPSNLTSSAVAYNQISLSWSDNSSNESGFQIERCTGAIGNCSSFALVGQVAPDIAGFIDLGAQPQTTYTYRVRAFNAAGTSNYSNAVDATTPAAPPMPPAAPSNLSSSAISYSQINLSWSDNSNNEDGFHLERCIGAMASCSNFVQIGQPGANVISFIDSGLQAQTMYTYRIRAFNSIGTSSYSNHVEAMTLVSAPAAPSNLTSSVFSYSQINLSWTDASDNEAGFRVERCSGAVANCAETSFVQIAQIGPNVTSFSNKGLQGQTTYTYRVRAFNSSGVSGYSNAAEATTTTAPPSSQVVPGGVQRVGANAGRFSWTGAGVGVAVVDTGLDFDHADLGLAPEIAGVNSFSAFGGSCQDFHGHGTHVGGIVAAINNTIDVVGVAPEATLYCVRVFEPDPVEGAVSTDEDLMAGLDWIATNANLVTPPIRVINMSLGRPKGFEDQNPSHPLHLAVKALYDMGISVVVAAGNDPASEATDQVPAGYPEVISVASTSAQSGVNGYDDFFTACEGVPNIKADTASYFTTDGAFLGGAGITVSAPGEQQEDIFSFSNSCFLESIGILSTAMGGGTTELSGTSMAAPHVAGVVALMWQKELNSGLNLSPESARTRIRNNVDRLGTAPLDSPTEEYTFDGQREGVIWAPSALGISPPPPPDVPPTVFIQSPANGSSFASGATISFQGTATDPENGNIASSLVWISSKDGPIGTGAGFARTLTNGNHVITASVTDSGGNTSSATTSVSVGSSSNPTQVMVNSVTYNLQGTTLVYTVKLVNEFGGAVAGANVEVDIMEWLYTGALWISSGTSNAQGNAVFQLPNVDFGCYVTSVRTITGTALNWVGGTPSNNFCYGF